MVLKADVSPPRHQWWYRSLLAVGRVLIIPPVCRMYKIRMKKYKGKIPDTSIVMFNHVSDYDFMGVLQGFPHYARFVASDALIRKRYMRYLMGAVSDFIFRRKGMNGDNVVESVNASIAKGVHVCIAPEGGESINGTTAYIRPRTGQMVKDANAGMVTFRMEGGYFLKPSWSKRRYKGPMYGGVVGVYTKEEMAAMTAEEINALIYRDLYVNSYEWQREHREHYEGEARAEFMEQVLYTCPKCKCINHMHSKCDTVYCSECGYTVDVDEYGFFTGDDVIFDNLYDWDVWQRNLMNSKVEYWKAHPEEIILSDEDQVLKGLENNYPYVIEDGVRLTMSASEITIKGKESNIVMPMEEVQSITVVSREDVGIIHNGVYYQIGAKVQRSGVKYKQLIAMLRGKQYL